MTDLSKDEVVKMAHEADDTIRSKPFTVEMLSFLERFATLCRAPLVAEVERLTFTLNQEALARENVSALRAQLADEVDSLKAERDDWKARALKAEQVGEPVAWNHGCNALCMNIDLWVDHCPHCGKPRPAAPVPQEPTSAVPVVEQLVEALDGLFSGDVVVWSLGGSARPRAAITAGQKFIKENGK